MADKVKVKFRWPVWPYKTWDIWMLRPEQVEVLGRMVEVVKTKKKTKKKKKQVKKASNKSMQDSDKKENK